VQVVFLFVFELSVFLGAMLHQIIARVSAYYEYNANTEISRSFVSGIEFPAVTICNFNRLILSLAMFKKLAC